MVLARTMEPKHTEITYDVLRGIYLLSEHFQKALGSSWRPIYAAS